MTKRVTDHEQITGPDPQPKPARRRWRWLRHVAVMLAGLLVLAGAAWATLPGRSFAAPDWLRDRVSQRIAETLPDHQVLFRNVILRIEDNLTPRLVLQDVELRDATGAARLSLSDIDARMSLSRAVRGQFQPRDVHLSGAVVTLRRAKDGTLDLAFGGAMLGQTAPGDMSSVVAAIDTGFSDPRLDALRALNMDGLTIRYEDARAGRIWTVDGGRVQVRKRRGEIQINGEFALLGGRDYASTLSVNYSSRIGSGAAEFGLNFKDMPAEDMAAQAAALAWLEVLRAPISGAMRGGISEDGTLLPLNGTLRVGTGVLQPTEQTRPIRFTSAQTYFTYVPGTQVLDFSDVSVSSQWLTVSASGKAALKDLADGLPGGFEGQFHLTELRGNPQDMFLQPRDLGGANLDFKLLLHPFSLQIGQLTLADPEAPARFDGRVLATDQGWSYALNGLSDQIAPDRVRALWPEALKPKTRDWVMRNVDAGALSNLQFSARGVAGQDPRLFLTFDFDDTNVRFLKTMPQVENGAGRFTILDGRMVVEARKGHVQAREGGRIDIAGTMFEIPNLRIPNPPARVHLVTGSTVTAALSLIDEPPLQIMTKAERPVTLADGRLDMAGVLSLPLKKKVQRQEVTFALTGTARDVSSTVLVPGRTLSAGRLAVQAQTDGLRISGTGRFGNVPFKGQWSLPLGTPGAASEVKARVTLNQDFVNEFKIGLPRGTVSGAAPADLHLTLGKSAPPVFELTSRLAGLGLRLDPLGWRKGPSTKGTLRVTGALAQPARVDRLSLEAPGLSATCSVRLTQDGRLAEARFDRVRAGTWLDAPVVLTGRGAGAAPAVRIAGGRVDMRTAPFGQGGQASEGARSGGPLTLALDQLRISDGIALRAFRGDFSTREGLSGAFTASVNGAAPVAGQVVPRNGRSAVRITSNDAGQVASAAGLLKKGAGGEMTLDLVPTPGRPGQYDGDLKVRNTRLREAPAMAALLHAISVVGLLEQLGGQGIYFSDVEAKFRLTPEQLILSRSSAVGPSMGISLDGYYAMATGQMDMQGVVSPIFMINGIGSVLTRKGEGLFGFNFRLRGASSAPKVSVNPLSALTPGMFREIFRRRAPKLQ